METHHMSCFRSYPWILGARLWQGKTLAFFTRMDMKPPTLIGILQRNHSFWVQFSHFQKIEIEHMLNFNRVLAVFSTKVFWFVSCLKISLSLTEQIAIPWCRGYVMNWLQLDFKSQHGAVNQ